MAATVNAAPVSSPFITAHRGASLDAPENTLAALRLGFAQEADAGECDLRLTRDDHAILLHDATTRRTAGVELSAATATLDALRRLDAGSWKGATYAGEKIPVLDEALAVVPPGRRLYLELKCGVEIFPALERAFAATAHPPGAFILMSFDLAVAAAAKLRFPAVEAHWIVEWNTFSRADLGAEALAAQARVHGLDGLNLDRRFPIDAAFVATVHAAGLKLCVWTVDDVALARRLAAAGVDGITTNRPGWLRERLNTAVTN